MFRAAESYIFLDLARIYDPTVEDCLVDAGFSC
jgi:hypothetical protein